MNFPGSFDGFNQKIERGEQFARKNVGHAIPKGTFWYLWGFFLDFPHKHRTKVFKLQKVTLSGCSSFSIHQSLLSLIIL